MSDNDKIPRTLLIVTEHCGRQLMGFCDVRKFGPEGDEQEVSPVEDAGGYICIHDPIVYRDMVVQTPHGPNRVTNMSTVFDFGWTPWIRVRASSFSMASDEAVQAYEQAMKGFRLNYERAKAARSGIIIADNIAADVATAEALNKMRVKQ